MTTTDEVLGIQIDNPFGTGSYVTHPVSSLVHTIEETYGVTAADDSNEALARQWCELRGFGFLGCQVVGVAKFKDLIGGQQFTVKGCKYLKLIHTIHGPAPFNAVVMETGSLHFIDPRMEVHPVN